MISPDEPRCTVGAIDRICFVRWSQRPTVDEVRAVVDAVLSERRSVGRPLVLFVIVRPDTVLPETSATMEMVRQSPIIDCALETGVTVFEGDALGTRLVRGSLQAIGAVLRTPWDITDDRNAALEKLCRRLGLDLESVRAEAVVRGLFPR